MKKFGKFIFGTISLATLSAGAYYLYKNLINKDSSDEFDEFDDEFDDEFEDFEDEEESQAAADKKDTREYVSINITGDLKKQDTVVDELADEGSEDLDLTPIDEEASE